jgi:hypothetical protein
MFKLLAVVFVIGVAFAASRFVGSVLENRAIAEHAAQERTHPARSLAESPPPLTPETRP